MSAISASIQTRHNQGLRRLSTHGRSFKDAICVMQNPPTPEGLEHDRLDHHAPHQLPGADIRLALPCLPYSVVTARDGLVNTHELADWIEEHGSDEQRHAWQWWQVEALAGTWKRGYGYVDCIEDYRDWCRPAA